MMRYKQKPPQVDAVHWTGDIEAVQEVFPEATVNADDDQICNVPTADGMGTYAVPMGNWISKNDFGSMHYLPDEIFLAVYEPV